MSFNMYSPDTEDLYDIKTLTKLSKKEHLPTQIESNDIPYLSKNFDINFLNEKEYKYYTMDTNFLNENDELNKVLNTWPSSGGYGDTPEDDIGFHDDNISHVGSDYSEFQAAEQENVFSQFNLADPYAGCDLNEVPTTYNSSELMLIPPSGSAMHFNYDFPAVPPQTAPPHTQLNINYNATVTNANTQMPYLYGNQSETGSTSAAAAATSVPAPNYSANSNSNQGCFHPNMWYPNASIGSYRSQSYGRQYGSQVSRDHMMDMLQLSNSGREARNRAEKFRRDKLNSSIQELSTMVPHVAESPRRVDKTAVLRFAAHGLRLKYVFGKSLNSESTQTTDALMKLLDSFFITMSCNGQIILVSSSIEQHLGHCQADLYGQNILHITHPEDHQMLKEKLIPANIDNLFDIQPEDETGEPRQRTQAEEDEIDRKLCEDKRSFTIRLARSGPRSEPTVYELVRIDGSFRRSDMSPRGLKTSSFPSTLQLMRRSRGREDIMPLHAISGNDIVLIAVARIVRPTVINRSVEPNRLEYKTRHLIDGRIIDCDQRISIVAGYMTGEVRNLSPFTFMHQDDARWVIAALRQMYDRHSSFGESTYRLFARNGKIIYLHSKGFLEIDKTTNKVHSFICVNTLLEEEEGKRRIKNMKNNFSVKINTSIPQAFDDVPASEDPQQLEKAVMCLIQNLKSSSDESADSDACTSIHSHLNSYDSTSPQVASSAKTPPPALVPPAASTIKSSITKSVNVVKTTAGKFLSSNFTNYFQQQNDSNSRCTSDPHTSRISDEIDQMIFSHNADSAGYLTSTISGQEESGHYSASGAIKRKIPYSISETDNDEYTVPRQRQAIENVLSSSLQQINNRLNQQLNTALELRDQSQLYELPHTEECIADIMKEHQKQQEMYEDISNEFEVQRKNSESSSSESEKLRKYTRNTLEEPPQLQEEEQQHSIRSTTTAATSTATSPDSVEIDAQLEIESLL